MQKQTDRTSHNAQPSAVRRFLLAATVLLLSLVAAAGYFLVNAYREGQEIRRYVGGPFGQQLLYMQACVLTDRAGADSLEAQLDTCRRGRSPQAGYFVYDFNIGRSVPLGEEDLALWKEYAVFSIPDSVDGEVVASESNPFNRIVPFADFTGFDYDCLPVGDTNDFTCKRAPASCDLSAHSIRCSVTDPHTGEAELHVIERDPKLDLLLPHGFITGPDIFKMLKPRFFPRLDS
ncbi:MAG: hypothetical protein OXF55_06415 [Caldilineaceae bacterium]|nr:hypothetical protein [Caldilineaceae bacterium]